MSSTEATHTTPAKYIFEYGRNVLADEMDGSGMPSKETLDEIARTLHAVQEFMIEPVAAQLEATARTVIAEHEPKPGLIPEEERPFDYADVGRLIHWADTLRAELGYTLDAVQKVALLAHDDIPSIVNGYLPDPDLQSITTGTWNRHLRRFHGLDVVS